MTIQNSLMQELADLINEEMAKKVDPEKTKISAEEVKEVLVNAITRNIHLSEEEKRIDHDDVFWKTRLKKTLEQMVNTELGQVLTYDEICSPEQAHLEKRGLAKIVEREMSLA